MWIPQPKIQSQIECETESGTESGTESQIQSHIISESETETGTNFCVARPPPLNFWNWSVAPLKTRDPLDVFDTFSNYN